MIGRQKHRKMDGYMDRKIDIWIDCQIDRLLDRQITILGDRQTVKNRYIDSQIDKQTYGYN